MSISKLPFKPRLYVSGHEVPKSPCLVDPLRFGSSEDGDWICITSCEVGFSALEFSQVIDALVHHPERNSPLILRADIESDTGPTCPTNPNAQPKLLGLQTYRPTRLIRRLLCPRQPKRDRALHQSCVFYARDQHVAGQVPTALVLSPDLSDEYPVPPFYHPAVRHLAIRYMAKERVEEGDGVIGEVVVDVVRLAGDVKTQKSSGASAEDAFPPRLVRTCVSLLDGVCRVGHGYANGYRKRVDHDVLVDKAEFQDLYLKMKDMYGGLVETWKEATDPSKHVFEDIGIATFLMLLWKDTYRNFKPSSESVGAGFPWSHYPRPPGGFRDIGCGNGLLTHILIASGYNGIGIDLRARKSWLNYPAKTQSCLKVAALDFTALEYDSEARSFNGLPEMLASSAQEEDRSVFFIGNHADELTPWMPLVAHAARADFINIPCCFWGLDERFQARKTKDMPGPSTSAQPSPNEQWELALADRLHSVMGGQADATDTKKGGSKQPSQYGRYMLWLARLQRDCGFEVEVEALRIPSTRNWAFAGRARRWKTEDEREKFDEYVDGLIRQVRQRGLFKTRVPEGKEGGFITVY
ncbi:tRNA(Ser) Um(44) 2'-O-methyltransferase [Ceratobasidium sp. UAMH 11750]|nr:tRNA(Ser) Um(44) 2'-O-methyltransferase [Ceratobasidium sp. UAMH 11750]